MIKIDIKQFIYDRMWFGWYQTTWRRGIFKNWSRAAEFRHSSILVIDDIEEMERCGD